MASESSQPPSSKWGIPTVMYSQLYSSILEQDTQRMRYISCDITKMLLFIED